MKALQEAAVLVLLTLQLLGLAVSGECTGLCQGAYLCGVFTTCYCTGYRTRSACKYPCQFYGCTDGGSSSSSSSSSSSAKSSSSGLSGGAIAGIVVAALVGLAALIGAALLLRRTDCWKNSAACGKVGTMPPKDHADVEKGPPVESAKEEDTMTANNPADEEKGPPVESPKVEGTTPANNHADEEKGPPVESPKEKRHHAARGSG